MDAGVLAPEGGRGPWPTGRPSGVLISGDWNGGPPPFLCRWQLGCEGLPLSFPSEIQLLRVLRQTAALPDLPSAHGGGGSPLRARAPGPLPRTGGSRRGRQVPTVHTDRRVSGRVWGGPSAFPGSRAVRPLRHFVPESLRAPRECPSPRPPHCSRHPGG